MFMTTGLCWNIPSFRSGKNMNFINLQDNFNFFLRVRTMLLNNFSENKLARTLQCKRNHEKRIKTAKTDKGNSRIDDFLMIFPGGSIFNIILTFFWGFGRCYWIIFSETKSLELCKAKGIMKKESKLQKLIRATFLNVPWDMTPVIYVHI